MSLCCFEFVNFYDYHFVGRKKGSIPHSRRRQGVPDSMMETTPEEKKTRKSNQQPRPEQKQQNNQGDEEEFIPIASDDNEMEMDMSSQTLTGNNNISASAASSDSSVSTPEKSQQLKSLSKEDGVVGKASFDWFAEEEDDEDEDGEEVTLPALDDESSVTVNSTSIPKIDTEMDRKIRQKVSKS